MPDAGTQALARNPTFRDVLAVREYRALWIAQLLSVGGDQFARVALSVLVYDRTHSPLLTAVTFAASGLPIVAGGLFLGWVADAFPRRTVLITCDLASVALVAVMIIPGLPLAALVVLLAAVTTVSAPFMAARQAVNREVLGAGLYPPGLSLTQATYQIAQIIGYAIGGAVVAVAGVRGSLAIDAGTFAVSALLIRVQVQHRPAADTARGPEAPHLLAGVRVVLASRVAACALGLTLLASWFDVPEGVAVPLARQFGGGAAAAGALLAAMTGGAAVGLLGCGRLAGPAWRVRSAPILAGCACAVLILFAFTPGLGLAMVILAASGLCTGYIVATSTVFANSIRDADRGKAFGVSSAALIGGQSLVIMAAGAAAGPLGASAVIAIGGVIGVALAVPLALTWHRMRPAT